jgi:hypothetical protein
MHWEHGYRVHGLWDDAGKRLGAVGIGPRNLWDGVYRWWVDGCKTEGEAATLRAAKRAVERAVASVSVPSAA